MNNELPVEEEIWKPAIKFGVVIPNYFISNLGRVKDENGKVLRASKRGSKYRTGGPGPKSIVNITIPKNLFKHRQDEGIGFVHIRIVVHRLVIETFKPLDEYPPIPKHEWDTLPESAKEIIRNCCIVDHIDNNPFNNRIENLRWCTPLENNPANKKKTFGDLNGKKQIATLEELFL
jgi:hypothetical protein